MDNQTSPPAPETDYPIAGQPPADPENRGLFIRSGPVAVSLRTDGSLLIECEAHYPLHHLGPQRLELAPSHAEILAGMMTLVHAVVRDA